MSKFLSKPELEEVIAKESNLTKAEAGRQLDAVLKGLTSAFEDGYGVKLIGFGNFEVKDVPEKEHKLVTDIASAKAEGRPIKTTITPAHKTVKCKISKSLIKSIN